MHNMMKQSLSGKKWYIIGVLYIDTHLGLLINILIRKGRDEKWVRKGFLKNPTIFLV